MTTRSTTPRRQPIDPRLRALRTYTRQLSQMLELVQHDADKGNVHKLRTSTRRSGAMLESLLAGRACSADERKQAEKLQQQWKKLRRAAGAVRDYDVHRDLLEDLGKKWHTRAQAPLLASAKKLDEWLSNHRDEEEKNLIAVASDRALKTGELQNAVLAWLLSPRSLGPGRRPAQLALEDFARIAAHFLTLDMGNLHDFRKRSKEARYLAEAGGAAAKPIERALKRIQDAIGDWHDYDALLLEAEEALGKSDALAELLRKKRDTQYRVAIAQSERVRARLLGEYYSGLGRAARRGDERAAAPAQAQ